MILVTGFVLFRLEILAAASVLRISSLLFSPPHVSRAFYGISSVVYSRLTEGGKGIWEAVCSWAIYSLRISYLFGRAFMPWLVLHWVFSLCSEAAEPATLLGVPGPE